MSDFLRKYWFICLLSVCMIGMLFYYIYDLNKDNVSAKQSDGNDVVASTTLGDVVADTIFDRYQSFNQSLLYNMYRNAVVDQAVEATSEMQSSAKTMAKTIKTNMESDSTNKTYYSIVSELASYGFNGIDSLQDYCLFSLKLQELDSNYVKDNFDSLKDTLTTSPRTISIITMEVPNAEILTEDAQAKQESIEKALEQGDSFASVATAFSEDVDTAAKEGFYGYIDSSTTDLDSAVISAATALEKGEVSDWITTTDSTTGNYVLYKVYVNETDPQALLDSEDEDVSDALVSAIISANSDLETRAIEAAASKLDITFQSEEVQSQVKNYISSKLGEDSE